MFCVTAALADSYAPLDHFRFEHDGIEREYFVHAPENNGDKMPVVFAIHGYTSTATGFAVFHDLRQHANDNGYIVVYPQGSHFVDTDNAEAYRVTSWNMFGDAIPAADAGPQCIEKAHRYPCPPECGDCDRCGWASCYDDLGFFEKLMDEVATNYDTDVRRYYALGMSNGGMMTLRLGCSLSNRFAAIAPVAAQLPAGFNCEPSTQLPMLHLAGAKDDVVPVDGGPASDGFVYESVSDTAAKWAAALQCDAGTDRWRTALSDKAGLQCTAYRDCAIDGHEVVSCMAAEETHNWPGRRPGGAWPVCVTSQQRQSMPEQRRCESRGEYGPHLGMDLIWAFFDRYRSEP